MCGNGGGCHGSQSTSAFWAVVPQAQEQVVIAHEIFETSTDPAINDFAGWDEAVDQCDNAPNISLPAFGKNFQIPPTTDNTQGGACSTSGYTSLVEVQDYGATHTEFVNDYHTRYNQGWRLYILQSYVLADGSTFGDVRYNAVWRPGNVNEQLLIELTNDQMVSQLNTLNSQGWRLYILQSYVLANGTVAYNAVLRAGTVPEHGTLGETFTRLVSDVPPTIRKTIVRTFFNRTLRPPARCFTTRTGGRGTLFKWSNHKQPSRISRARTITSILKVIVCTFFNRTLRPAARCFTAQSGGRGLTRKRRFSGRRTRITRPSMTTYSHKVGACTFLMRMCCPMARYVTTQSGGSARLIDPCNGFPNLLNARLRQSTQSNITVQRSASGTPSRGPRGSTLDPIRWM